MRIFSYWSSRPSMVYWLSSSIFPCSFVVRCLLSCYGNTRPNLHLLRYIQAWEPFTNPVPLDTDPVPTSTAPYWPSTTKYQPVPPLYWPSTIIYQCPCTRIRTSMRDLHCLLGLVKICFHFLIFYPGWIEQEKNSPFLPHRYCYFYPVLFKYLSWFPCVFNFNQESSCKTIPLGNFYVWSFWSIFERLMGYNIVHKMCSHQILEVILLVGDSNYKKLFCFFSQVKRHSTSQQIPVTSNSSSTW